MERRAIFLDIDGTLTLPGRNEPPASAVEAVRRARAKGNLVFLCSGRNEGMLAPLLAYGFDGYIASSGGHIVCGEEVIYDGPMTEEQFRRAEEILRRNGIYITVECRDGSFTDDSFKNFLRDHAGEGQNSELLRWQRQIEANLNIRPIEEYRGQPVYKMVLMMQSADQLAEPVCLLGEEFEFCLQTAGRFGIRNAELVGRNFDKGRGIKRVCEYLGIPVSDTVAFGDSMNDKEMMETVGFSVCMANGSGELKKISDAVCPAVEDDGLYKAFEQYGLMD